MSKSILKPHLSRRGLVDGSDGLIMSGSSTDYPDSDSSLHREHDGCVRPDSIPLHHHVHFATDTRIYLTHSTTEYDRSPMKVMKNPCAMPERGCPGLTYVPMDDGPGGRERGVRDLDAAPNGGSMESSPDDSTSSEAEDTDRADYGMASRDRPCQRYALKVSAQKRRRKLNNEMVPLGGNFRSLSAFSNLVSSPNDCFGGF